MPDVGNTRARYRRILRFAARYIVQTWWFELVLPRIGLAKVAARGRAARLTRIAQRFHVLAVDLGGLMIKVGQYLSSRLDVLPPEITKELAGSPGRSAARAVRRDPTPRRGRAGPAARARVRVVRPDTAGRGIPRSSAPRPALADRRRRHGARRGRRQGAATGHRDDRRRRPVGAAPRRRVAQPRAVRRRPRRPPARSSRSSRSRASRRSTTCTRRRNAERFAANFAGDPRVAAPEVVWERTTRRVLTLADVTAIKINDREALRGGRHRPEGGREAVRGRHVRPALPRRLLPRRPAPRQHLRHAASSGAVALTDAASPRGGSPSSTSA